MPRARHGRLTDTFIESLLPQEGGRERIVRDGAIPGFLIRVGLRKRIFELRIEKPPKITVPVGHWPGLCAVEARRKHSRAGEIRIGCAIDDAVLDPPGTGNADHLCPVSPSVSDIDGSPSRA